MFTGAIEGLVQNRQLTVTEKLEEFERFMLGQA